MPMNRPTLAFCAAASLAALGAPAVPRLIEALKHEHLRGQVVLCESTGNRAQSPNRMNEPPSLEPMK